MIFTDVILLYSGNHADTQLGGSLYTAGWRREDTFNTKFVKGWNSTTTVGERPNDTGGATAHSHTGESHTHNPTDSHSHAVELEYTYSNGNDIGGSNDDPICYENHYHPSKAISTRTGGVATNTIAYPSVADNNAPPHKKLIFVKGTAGAIPQVGMIGLWNSSSLPTNWGFCDGSSSTPDLRNHFPRGAGGSENANLTSAGSNTHTHVLDHSHSTSHTHSGNSNDGSPTNVTRNAGGTGTLKKNNHQHLITLNSATVSTNTYTATLTSSAIEPVFKKLIPIQRKSGGTPTPKGLIGLWLGTIASIPAGWKPCDGGYWEDGITQTPNMKNYYLKFVNDTSEVGGTTQSGVTISNSHSHAASNSHGHSEAATHYHPSVTVGWAGQADGDTQTGGYPHPTNHTHTVKSNGYRSATLTWENSNMSAESQPNEPEYVVAAFIQLTKVGGGSVMLNFL